LLSAAVIAAEALFADLAGLALVVAHAAVEDVVLQVETLSATACLAIGARVDAGPLDALLLVTTDGVTVTTMLDITRDIDTATIAGRHFDTATTRDTHTFVAELLLTFGHVTWAIAAATMRAVGIEVDTCAVAVGEAGGACLAGAGDAALVATACVATAAAVLAIGRRVDTGPIAVRLTCVTGHGHASSGSSACGATTGRCAARHGVRCFTATTVVTATDTEGDAERAEEKSPAGV